MAVLNDSSSWPSALSTGFLWCAAAASAVFWTFRLTTPVEAAVPAVPQSSALQVDSAAVARALGARPVTAAAPAPVAEAARRFSLFGVIADEQGRGVALLSVDGKAPRPYRAGHTVADGYVLSKVQGRSAHIAATGGASDAAIALELPLLPVAENGPERGQPQLSN